MGCEDSEGPPATDVVSDISDAELEPVQSDEALAYCEALEPSESVWDEDAKPTIYLLGLGSNPDGGYNHYAAEFEAVDGMADIRFPMAVCPFDSTTFPLNFKGVRCRLWVGGSHPETEEIGLAHGYEPCEFSSVPAGQHDVKVELCCFNDCSNGLETCNYGSAWVDVVID